MKIKKWLILAFVFVVGLALYFVVVVGKITTAQNVTASISDTKVKIGSTIKITSDMEGLIFESSDSSVAKVNKEGEITGKKKGTVSVLVTKDGYVTKTFSVQVVSADSKPTSGIKPTNSATKNDKKAPVITGLVGDASFFNDSVFLVVYPDTEYDFSRYVKVKDDIDKDVELEVDTSMVDYTKEGNYDVTFTATDSAGNSSTAVAKVQVRFTKKVDSMADELLSEIVDDTMTDQQKAEAIYVYIRKNVSYVDGYNETNWEKAAEYAMKYNGGDCFAYYSISRILLTRAGIPNMMVTRYKGEGHHWWNLVYVDGGWYHFDTTPRSKQATFCLVTSQQLADYSKKGGNSHIWDVPKYPKTATKEINKVEWGKRY